MLWPSIPYYILLTITKVILIDNVEFGYERNYRIKIGIYGVNGLIPIYYKL